VLAEVFVHPHPPRKKPVFFLKTSSGWFIYVEEVKDYRKWNDYGLSDISLYLVLTYIVLLAVFGFLENRRKMRKN